MILTLIDGVEAGTIPVTDSSVLRGDGCFEAIRSYGGRLFALGDHLDRMERSAALLQLPTPDRSLVEGWCRGIAREGGTGIVRVVLTRGGNVPGDDSPPRCIVIHHPLWEEKRAVRLLPLPAPWHPAGRPFELAGAKTLSYAPNLAGGRAAQAAGFDDALLVSSDGILLEGPTFCVGWVVKGVLETPGLDLYVLDSITRRYVLAEARAMGVEVVEGRFPLGRLEGADEVMAFSTTKEVIPVTAVGERRYPAGPLTERLRASYLRRVDQEISAQGGAGR